MMKRGPWHFKARIAAVFAAVVVRAALATDVPSPDLRLVEPQVAEKVERHRRAVEASPTSADAWGRYGMVLDAHAMSREARVAYEEAHRLAPQDFRWSYLHGVLLLLTEPATARESLQKAVSISPDYPPARIWLGQALDMLGESDAAWEQYHKAAHLAPNNPWVRMSLGKAALERNELDIARKELHAANEMAPDFGVILSLLAKLHMRLGDEQAAAAFGERAGDHMNKTLVHDPIYRRVTDEGVSISMYERRADLFRGARMFEEAIDEYRMGLQHAPDELSLLVGLIETLAQAQRPAESLAEADRAISRGVDSLYVHRTRSIALYQLRRYEEAERAARELLQEHPRDALQHRVLALVAAALGRHQEAVSHFEQALAIDATDKDARLGLARVLVASGRFEEAQKHLDIIAARMAGDPQFELLMGMAKLGQRKFEEALAPLERSLAGTIADWTTVRLYASALVGLERFTEAEERLRAFHMQFPQVVLVANDLAWLLATCPDEEIRDGEEAVAIARSAAESPQGHNPTVLDTLAAAYAEAGRFDDAVRMMDEVIELARTAGADPSRMKVYEDRRALFASGKAYRTEPVKNGKP